MKFAGGFTLIEVVVASALLVAALGMLTGLYIGFGRTIGAQRAQMRAQEEARRGMEATTRELIQAARTSLEGLPSDAVRYRIAIDADGNGVAVDVNGNLELSAQHCIRRDASPVSPSKRSPSDRLVLIDGDKTQVLANGLLPNEDANGNGALDEGEDRNGNGKLDRGVWFEDKGQGLRVTIQTRAEDKRGRAYEAELSQVVAPRN